MENIRQINAYLSKISQKDFLKEYFLILGYYSEQYLQKRSHNFLLKLAKARFVINQKILKALLNDDEVDRKIFIKFLAVKFQNEPFKKKVLGILIGFTHVYKHEKFEYDHLLNVLKKLIPGIHILKDSFSSFVKENQLVCYCEIEKIRGKNLNFAECIELKKRLKNEIKDGIEFLSPHLFIPKNEEDILRNVLKLDQEVSCVKDLPHVTISFEEQLTDVIRFMVIIVRVRKENAPN